MNTSAPPSAAKITICVLIMVSIGLMHAFRIGQLFSGQLFTFFYSYASDIILPFGIYFMLALNDSQIKFLKPWYVKAGLIFAGATGAEILQYFGFYALGVTFDPLDIVMYGIGVLIAAFLEVFVFRKFVRTWNTSNAEEKNN